MATAKKLAEAIGAGAYDAIFADLYGGGEARIAAQRRRYTEAMDAFEAAYGAGREVAIYSTPGRTEIGGNHTDHNNGIVLAAAVNRDIIAVVARNSDGKARVKSKGFAMPDAVDLGVLTPDAGEYGQSAGLIRGVAAGMKARGGEIGGFDAYTTSDILKGSGLSSSAAFEVCMGSIFNGEYNRGRFTPVELGMIGQYAENVFFGKPSGLMDQTACAVGSAMTIDLADPAQPVVEKIPFDLEAFGFSLVITDTRGDHANLTGDYAAIRAEMERVAAFFGKKVLREVAQADFMKKLPEVRRAVGDRPLLRALHFYGECTRAKALAAAITRGDMDTFLHLIKVGGHSSFEYNQNAYSTRTPDEQPVPLALALSQGVLRERGAWRLQGGGFAGTIQAFVPHELLGDYCRGLDRVFGDGAAQVMAVRSAGCLCVSDAVEREKEGGRGAGF